METRRRLFPNLRWWWCLWAHSPLHVFNAPLAGFLAHYEPEELRHVILHDCPRCGWGWSESDLPVWCGGNG
jgi:hypothetical protein